MDFLDYQCEGHEVGATGINKLEEQMQAPEWTSKVDREIQRNVAHDMFSLGVILFFMVTNRMPWTTLRDKKFTDLHKAPE
jgi:hypothetical protein